MKKSLFSILGLLLSVTLLFSGCSDGLLELEYDKKKDAYIDSENDITYLRAPANYEAFGVKTGLPYAEIRGKSVMTLYEIDHAEPERMIANEYFEIFYAKGTKLPKLWEMQVDTVYVARIVQDAQIDISDVIIEDEADIAALILQYQRGETASFDEGEMMDGNAMQGAYRLRFASEAHPAFYYCLEYREYEEDVVIYEIIESKETFVPTYGGALSTSFDERYVESDGLYAVYHFGKNILCDPVTGEMFAARDTVAKHLNG